MTVVTSQAGAPSSARRPNRAKPQVIARYCQHGAERNAPFGSLKDAYEFLCRGREGGDFEVVGITAEDGEVLITRTGFAEVSRLDDAARRGWFNVLAHALAAAPLAAPAPDHTPVPA